MVNTRPCNQAEQTAKSETPSGSYTHSYKPKLGKRLILHQLCSSSYNNRKKEAQVIEQLNLGSQFKE